MSGARSLGDRVSRALNDGHVRAAVRTSTRAAALILALTRSPALAHTLDTGTARVSLRDAHLEVLGEWDVFAAADTTPTALAIATPDEAKTAHASLRRAIEAGSTLEVDGRAYALELTGFPSVDELRSIAASLSAQGLDHGALVRVRLEVREPIPGAERVHVRFPPDFGPVLVTFVQPSTVFTPPGAVARFGVLAPQAPTREREPASPAWAVGGALALFLAAIYPLIHRKKTLSC